MNSWEIAGHTLEFVDDIHIYLVDGIVVPSVSKILRYKFPNKYDNVDKRVLERAAAKGTEIHEAIEKLCKTGEIDDFKEVKNFIFLQKQYNFEVLDNEVPLIIFLDNKPVAAGRLDLDLKINDEEGLGDIKRTSVLDKEHLAYQLNLYRIGFQQSYNKDIKFLRGLHLRDDVRKFVNIPINEEMAINLLKDFLESESNGEQNKEWKLYCYSRLDGQGSKT